MVYEDSVKLDNYIFEDDGFGNIHVYKADTNEYQGMIDLSSSFLDQGFLSICKEWIRKKDES